MFYEKNKEKELSLDLFRNPTSEYRATPFWAWNDDLKEEELLRQIEEFKKMGFGGFHMHVRAGLSTPYLSSEFMSLVKACVNKAKSEKMLAYLYDEDRWPSGFAGGLATKDHRYRQKSLLLLPGKADEGNMPDYLTDAVLLAVYEVKLNENGTLKAYERVDEQSASDQAWYAYCATAADSGRYNNEAYLDTLSEEAVGNFIAITHEKYAKEVGEEFGKTVPSIFTDEPQFTRCNTLAFAESKQAVLLPWSADFAQTYQQAYGQDLFDDLPQLLWDLDGKPSKTRMQFHEHVSERFTKAFAKQIGEWCDKHGIALTGHMMEEDNLCSQTHAVGEAMRAYPYFGIPGIDLLCDRLEITTAKQAQSAVRQYGKEAMLSELYGVTGWDFEFKGHKFQGDWQAALGVTVRVPHLSWYSMKGMAKRDYPASISYQSCWYEQYKYVEDHFARVNTALTRGKPVVRVGVLHPIESYWLYNGPNQNTAQIRDQLDKNFRTVAEGLLKGGIDFDYVSESLLPSQVQDSEDKTLRVGEMAYEAIVVADFKTIRSSSVKLLSDFAKKGGKVVWMGEKALYVDAQESGEIDDLYAICKKIPFSIDALLQALEPQREVWVYNEHGEPSNKFVYQMRRDGEDRWVFFARLARPDGNGYNESTERIPDRLTILVNGKVTPKVYDTLSGEVKTAQYQYKGNKTEIYASLYAHDSLLLKLCNGATKPQKQTQKPKNIASVMDFKEKVNYSLHEDNVLVLDMPEWRENEQDEWMPREEILRIDKKLRKKYAYPAANGDVQPWVIGKLPPDRQIYLRYTFRSDKAYECKLAYEEATAVTFNGVSVPVVKNGNYVDTGIYTMAMPKTKKGVNVLEITAPFGNRITLENYFLLGAFGVKVEGCQADIVALPAKLAFGSIVEQGLPFYGGALTYHLPFSLTKKTDLTVQVFKATGAVTAASLDGEEIGKIAFAPYRAYAKAVKRGKHTLDLTLYNTRVNCFGALHCFGDIEWKGANHWFTEGEEWSYEYQLKRNGILKSPTVETCAASKSDSAEKAMICE